MIMVIQTPKQPHVQKKEKKRKTSRHPYKMSFFVILPAFVWISLNSFIISVNLICENVMPGGVSIYRL